MICVFYHELQITNIIFKIVLSSISEGENALRHIYEYADVFHSEQIEAVADRFSEEYAIKDGIFDNVNDCKYTVPDYWSIGSVYQRLIENVNKSDLITTLIEVYNSWITEYIDD